MLASCALLIATFTLQAADPDRNATGPGLVGIDHIPIAVGDLDAAAAAFERLGFALKPGRAHPDGIRNAHVKFPDGSGLELLMPPVAATDGLGAGYRARLQQGDGPAYLFLHARDQRALSTAFAASGIAMRKADGSATVDVRGLEFLAFNADNRSPTDRPAHFAHANGAIAMSGVWLAPDAAARDALIRLLTRLGAVARVQTIEAPDRVRATVIEVRNGRIVLLPERLRVSADRPIVGVEFAVRDIAAVARRIAAIDGPVPAPRSAGTRRLLVDPRVGHGLWLAFHAIRASPPDAPVDAE